MGKPSIKIPCIFLGIFALLQVEGALQKITIYQKKNQQGDGVVLTGKYPTLDKIKYILDAMEGLEGGSYCATGMWDMFDRINYGYNRDFFLFFGDTMFECADFYWSPGSFAESLRHVGPPDWTTPAISFFEGTPLNPDGHRHYRGGREYMVTDLAGNGLEFEPMYMMLFGNLSWTVYSGGNFDGESFCFRPNLTGIFTGEMRLDSTFIPRSVARGCDF